MLWGLHTGTPQRAPHSSSPPQTQTCQWAANPGVLRPLGVCRCWPHRWYSATLCSSWFPYSTPLRQEYRSSFASGFDVPRTTTTSTNTSHRDSASSPRSGHAGKLLARLFGGTGWSVDLFLSTTCFLLNKWDSSSSPTSLLEWHCSLGCACCDGQNALRWASQTLGEDPELLKNVHIALLCYRKGCMTAV